MRPRRVAAGHPTAPMAGAAGGRASRRCRSTRSSHACVGLAAGERHRQRDVLDRGQRRNEVVGLEDEAEAVAADLRQLLVGKRAEVDVADVDVTARERVEPGEAVQQRRLARARRTHDRRVLGASRTRRRRCRARGPPSRRCRRSSCAPTARRRNGLVGGIVVVTRLTPLGRAGYAMRRVIGIDPERHRGSSDRPRRHGDSVFTVDGAAGLAAPARRRPSQTNQQYRRRTSTADSKRLKRTPKIFDASSTRSASNQMRPNVYSATYERERLTAPEMKTAFAPRSGAEHEQAPQRLVEERRMERRVLLEYPAGGARRSIFNPHGSVVGRPNNSWLK